MSSLVKILGRGCQAARRSGSSRRQAIQKGRVRNRPRMSRLTRSKKRAKASAPFSVFSRAAAGTSDDSVGDGLGDADALGEALLTVADGVGDPEGVSSDWHPPSTTAAPSATAATARAARPTGPRTASSSTGVPCVPSPGRPSSARMETLAKPPGSATRVVHRPEAVQPAAQPEPQPSGPLGDDLVGVRGDPPEQGQHQRDELARPAR